MTFKEFLRALMQSFLTSEFAKSVVFILIVSTVCYLALKQQPIPVELQTLVAAVIGYYFRGAQTNGQTFRAVTTDK